MCYDLKKVREGNNSQGTAIAKKGKENLHLLFWHFI
jgi:hypothetical protein